MANADLLIDILSDLEQRSALDAQSSIDELLASDSELQEQLASDPELASEVRRALAALRDLDSYLGRHGAAGKQALPTIPGYTIESELGFGGMGTVYKAQQESLKRPVAVKVIWKHGLRSHLYDKRVRAEAEMVARLEHPHIVQIYETGETPTAHYLVLEYMSAGNLANRLEGRPQPERLSAEIVSTIARTVEYAHSRGIIHRDLKPSNILQATDGTLKIADFGLAKMQDVESNLTASGEALGTPGYMAPEQTRGKYSERTDIYALGAILYELLTGRPPFSGETAAETLVQVQTTEPVAPRLIRTRLSPDLEAICLKCLEKDPARRYASAHELAHDLDRFMAGRPTIARPMSSPQKLVRLAQRQPLAAGLTGGILLLLLAVTTISTVAAIWINRSRREAENIAERETAARAEATELRLVSEQSVRDLEARDRKQWRGVYAANMRRAYDHYKIGRMDQVSDLLGKSLPSSGQDDLRSFEWYFLKHEMGQAGRRDLTPEGGRCYYVTYSPDARLILAGTEAGYVTIWDAASFAKVHAWKAHDSCVNQICFSPDGQLVATTSCDKTARFWHTADWQPASERMQRSMAILRCVFTPDGKRFITSTLTRNHPEIPPELTIWDVATAQQLYTTRVSGSAIYELEIGLDGTRLVAINESNVVLQWDVRGDELVKLEHNLTDDVPAGGFCGMAMAPDRRTILYSSPPDGVEIVDLATNSRRRWKHANLNADCLAVSPDMQYVALGNKWTMASIRRMIDGSLVDVAREIGNAYNLRFSPDGKQLTAASDDGKVYLTTLGSPERSGQPIPLRSARAWQTLASQSDCRLNGNGTRLWHKDGNCLVVQDLQTGKCERLFDGLYSGAVVEWDITPDENNALISSLKTGRDHYYLLHRNGNNGQLVAEFDSQVTPRFDASGSRIAGFMDNVLWIRNVSDGCVIDTFSAPNECRAPMSDSKVRGRMNWVADGEQIVFSLQPECMRCDLRTGNWTGMGFSTIRLEAVQRGNYVLAHRDRPSIISVYDRRTGEHVVDLANSSEFGDISPDGRRSVRVSSREAELFDISTGETLFTFHAETYLHSAHFSPDGRRLILIGAASSNGDATAWMLFADPPDE